MAMDVQLAKARKSGFSKVFGFGVREEFEREYGKLANIIRARRKKITLKKKTITRADVSITVDDIHAPRPTVTVQTRIRRAEIYAGYAEDKPEVVSAALRSRLPALLDRNELEKPIGHLADDMSSAELRLLMERAKERDRAKAENMLGMLEQIAAEPQTNPRLKRYSNPSAKLAVVPKPRSRLVSTTSSASKALVRSYDQDDGAQLRLGVLNKGQSRLVSTTPSASKALAQSYDRDDASQLQYYQRLGVVSKEQSRKILEQQREKLKKARAQERVKVEKFARAAGSYSQIAKYSATQRQIERRLSMISEGRTIGLVPREVIRDMHIKRTNSTRHDSWIAKRTTGPAARTNAFFRNRNNSLLVAKLSSTSLDLVFPGNADGVLPNADMIGSIAPKPQSMTVSASSITVLEETITFNPDDPIPKPTERPTYRYEPLDTNQHLRLLSVEPFIESGRFLYDIKMFRMTEAPRFESVSYVWGQDVRNFKLSFSDSTVLKITKSLFAALPVLSEHCRTGYLWIDQICIDQSNVDERNHQVKNMQAIYKQAEKVLVFLDPALRLSRLESFFALVDFVDRTLPVTSLSVTTTPTDYGLLQQALAQVIQPHYSNLSDHAVHWRDLVRLFRHPWFTRAWIFQELVLSDIVLFAMGRKLATLDAILHLALTAASLEGRALSEFRDNECLTKSSGLRQLQLMAKVRNDRLTYGNTDPASFWAIVSHVAPNCESSDERDKLYAFLGLLEDPRIDIRPDYRSSVTEVFIHAASAVITGQESLDMLAFVDRITIDRNSNSDFPSWVPDWRRPQIVRPFNQNAFSAAMKRKYASHNFISRSPAMSRGLLVSGRTIDQVVYVAASSFRSTKPWKSRDISNFLNLEEHVDKLIRNFGQSLGKPVELLDRLLRTILADGAEHSLLSNGRGYTPLHPADVKRLLQTYHRYVSFVALHHNTTQPIHAKSTVPAPLPELLQQLRQLSDIAFGRRIFVTEKLRLGLGPEKVAVGDSICILHGSSLPVVLRKHAYITGQCFVERIMQGEAVNWAEDEADEFWVF